MRWAAMGAGFLLCGSEARPSAASTLFWGAAARVPEAGPLSPWGGSVVTIPEPATSGLLILAGLSLLFLLRRHS
jgi:hypothetical protein